MLRAIAGALLAASFAAAPASAQFLEMSVHAVTYRPVPDGALFQVRARGDSDLDRRAQAAVEAVLTERGYALTDKPTVVLTVETASEFEHRETGTLGSGWATEDEAQVLFNVWSTQQSSILQGRRTAMVGRMRYRIDLAVYDRATGHYLWRGTVSTDVGPAGARSATGPMVERLMDSLGRDETSE